MKVAIRANMLQNKTKKLYGMIRKTKGLNDRTKAEFFHPEKF